MDEFTKEIGLMIIDKGLGLSFIRTKTHTKGSSGTGRLMEWESINGQTERAMMGSG